MSTDNSKKNIGLMTFLTVFSFISVLMDFDIPEGYDFNTIDVWSNISHSVHGGTISNILILLGIVALLYISFFKIGKAKNTFLLLFLSFGLSILNYIGISFDRIGSWDLYFNIHNGQLIKSCIKTTGMTIIAFHLISCLYYCFDKKSLFFSSFVSTDNKRKTPIIYLFGLLGKHPFAFSFVSLIILYIPYIIVSYPATFQEDADSVLLVYYKESFRYLFDLVPLLYTFVARVFFEIGIRMFGSENVGLFLLSITQFLVVVLAISLMINYLVKKERLRTSIAFLIIAFFGFLPLVQSYMFLMIKDVFYAAFLLMFALNLRNLIEEAITPSRIIKTGIFGLLVFLLRNDAPYVLLLLFVVLIICCRKKRVMFLSMAIIVVLLQFLARPAVYKAIGVQENYGSFLFTVPGQQTARCALYLDDKISQEDKDVIDKALGYDFLRGAYMPENSNQILWNRTMAEASTKDKINWLLVWAKLVLKHPGTCIQATLNNYYGYFSLSYKTMDINTYEFSNTCMNNVLDVMDWGNFDFYYPSKLDKLRELYMQYMYMLRDFPIICFFMKPSVYFWIIALLWGYKIRNKSLKGSIFLLVSSIIMLVCLTAPPNAFYGRYEYPVVLLFPITLFSAIKEQEIPEKIQQD